MEVNDCCEDRFCVCTYSRFALRYIYAIGQQVCQYNKKTFQSLFHREKKFEHV